MRMPSTEGEYFEGEIEYELVYESLNPDISTEEITKKSTDRKILHFKDGNSMTENYIRDTLTSRTWYDRLSNTTYIQKLDSDTLYFYNSSNVDFIMEPLQEQTGETILGHATRQITIALKGKDNSNYTGSESQFIFHIALDLPIDSIWFKDCLEFDYNKIMSLAPGMILKEEDSIYGYRKLIKRATRIERKLIELDLSIDSTKVLIEI